MAIFKTDTFFVACMHSIGGEEGAETYQTAKHVVLTV